MITITPREQKKLMFRQRILNCASFLFERKGFSETSIADIMKSANLGIGTFYNYFDSKEELLLELLKILSDDVESSINEYKSKDNSSLNLLSYACTVMAEFLSKNKFVLPLFLSASKHSDKPELIPIHKHTPTFKPIFELIIQEGQSANEIRDDVSSSLIAEMFHSIYQSASFSKLNLSFQKNIELKVKILIEGIKK